ncbi:MAG: PAS domain S-box protein [Plectolyngbya sp. WJT66-NPBG17]|jgi:PAS domain S-box-containing protein|nr:PAS domain S-box protein [Plectolyngbya sp. WJT66-NPBG17]
MLDTEKTKEQLLDELAQLRQRVQQLEQREEQCKQREQGAHQRLVQEQTARSQIEQSLQAAIQERNVLQDQQHFLEKLTGMSPGLVYLFDVIEQRNIYINARSLDLLGYAPETVLMMGADFMAQRMHPDDFARMPAHFEQLTRMTDGHSLELEYRMRHGNGEWQWFSSRDIVFSYTADGKVRQILGTAEDITARKQAEHRRDIQYAIAQILAEATTISDALPTILQAICENLGWQLGVFWSVNHQTNCLHYSDSWRSPTTAAHVLSESNLQTTFAPGVGLPGRVWLNRQPLWISNLKEDSNFPRAAQAAQVGLQAVFGFPILLSDQVLGVIECFCDRVQEPDTDLLNMMAAIGSQIGQFIERKRTEASLKESHELFQSFMNHSPIAAFIKDEAGRYVYVNPWIERVYQRSQADLIGKTDFELLPPAIAEQFREHDLAVLTSRQLMQTLETIHHEDGEHCYMSFKFPFWNAAGQPLVAGVAIDVSERIQAEAALQQREAELRLITNSLPVLISFIDSQQRYRFINQTYEEWFGQSASEMCGKHLCEVLGEVAYEGVRPYVEQVLAGHPVSFENEMPYKTIGTKIISAAFVPQFDPQGQVEGFVALVSDITQRKQAEETLQQSEERLRIAQQAANAGIWNWDIALNQVTWSEEYYGLYGLDPAVTQPSYENWLNSIAEQDRDLVDQSARQALEHQTDLNVEFRVLHPSQGERWLTAIGQTFYDDVKQPIRMTGIALDITERKQAETALRESEVRFQAIARNVPGMIYRYVPRADGSDVFTYVSSGSRELLELEPTDVLQDSSCIWKLFHPDDLPSLQASVAIAINNLLPWQWEGRLITPSGRLKWIQGKSRPEPTEEGIVWDGLLIDITERKQAEQALRESEEWARLAIQVGRLGGWRLHLETNLVEMDQRMREIWGEPEDAVMVPLPRVLERMHPDDRSRVADAVSGAIDPQSTGSYEIEYRIVWNDGTERWVLAKGQAQFEGEGESQRTIDFFGTLLDITATKQGEAERKQVAAALAQSNQTLQAIIQACPLAIMGLRSDGTVQIWNPAAERIFGWSQQEVLGNFLPAIPDNKQNEFLTNLAVTIQGQGLTGVEAQRQRKGNVPFDVELWTAPVDETQAGISCVSVVADITARKQTEAALRLSEERLHSFVSANVIGILFGDLEGGIQEANDEFLRIVGYTREDLQAGRLRWIDITPPEYLPLDEEAIVEARSRGACTPYEKEYIRKDGRRVPVLIGFSLAYGVREEAVTFILDLNDRKQAEESLRQSEERLRLALSVGQSGIWDWDIVNNHITWSEQIYQFHGLTPGTFSGKAEDFAELIHPEDRTKVLAAIQQAIEQRSSYETEFRAVQSSGAIRWLSTKGGVIFDSQGYPVRMLGATIDITERKAIEAEREQLLRREQFAREQAEAANRVKDEFLAVLSHELRTPLNPILGWTRLLRTRSFDATATDRALDTIERNAKLQSQLIEDLLDVSRILQGKVRLEARPVDLVTTIEAALETVRLSAEAKGIQLQTAFNSGVGQTNGDANRLQQIVWNLLSNAIKFTPSGGRVQVRLDRIGTDAQIQVSDTGEGISPDFLPYIFEYFRQADSSTTRRFGGLGLGLAIVRHLVELHGGTVKAESLGVGMGTTFTVQLPLMVSALTPDLESRLPTQEMHHLNDVSILVVDDEADMRELIRFILEEQGATVRVAASAAEALQQISESLPDIVISDIGMPEMDGYALMRQIRMNLSKQERMVPAIALTAYAGDVNERQALSAGFQRHLAKPIEPEQLLKTIAQAMAESFQPPGSLKNN